MKPTFTYKMEKMGWIVTTNLMTCDNWNAMIQHVNRVLHWYGVTRGIEPTV